MSYNDKKNLTYNTEKRRKIKEIKNNELNKECFDCGAGYPEYISINNGIFICKECLNIHNNFPKQISNTLKNNLSSLNNKELEFMYLGGNQKLLEFINYEYPQLQRYKINILYQTKAMQYYRNNLNYLVYGGIKPIKPNEKINAYELININDEGSKRENINACKKVDNLTYREAKRNRSETTLDTVNQNNIKKKNKTYKSKKKKRKISLLDTNDEDSLKRYKSFYKEMNKIFGEDIDIINEEQRNSKVIERKSHKEPNRISDNYKRKNFFNNGNENNVSKNNQYKNNTHYNSKKTSNKEPPIEHIYNNNYFTLSATKNIFMFTPNKDSIIYKHRKIKNDKNINQNNENIQSNNTIKEIYSKPKIPYLLTLNKKRESNHNLFLSLQENNFKHHNDFNLNDENVNGINIKGDKYIKNINEISKESKHNTSNKKNENKEINIDKNIKKNSFVDNLDIKYIHKNSNLINSSNDNRENDNNAVFSKKRINKLMKREKQTLENENKLIDDHKHNDKKGNTFIIYRNEKKENLDESAQNEKNDKNENKIDKIMQSLKKNIKNDINIEDNKNKTFTEIRESNNKRKNCIYSNNNPSINFREKDKKNPIRIEEGEEDIISPGEKQIDLKENSRGEENKNIEKREEDKKLKYDSKKIDENKNLEIKDEHDKNNKDGKKFVDKRRKRFDKCIGIKEEVEKDVDKEKKINNEKHNNEINKKEEKIKQIEKKEKENYIMKKFEKLKDNQDSNLSPFNKENSESSKTSLGRRQLRREHKDYKIDNPKDIHFHNSGNPSCVFDKNFTDVSKNTNDNKENNGTKKFSIRNKYKMKKLKELV